MDGTAELAALSYESCEHGRSSRLMCHAGMASHHQLALTNSLRDLLERQRDVLGA
jgi:hypothetical protein